MKIILCTFLLIMLPMIHAQENLSKLIENLDNEDFYVREESQKKLCDYDGSYYDLFLKLAHNTENIEQRHRLVKISEYLYKNKAIKDEEKYKRYLGTYGFKIESNVYEIDPENEHTYGGRTVIHQIMAIEPNSPVKDILKNGDILHYADEGYNYYRHPMPNETRKISITRLNPEDIDEFGEIKFEKRIEVLRNLDKYKELTFEITAGEIPEQFVDWEGVNRYKSIRWTEEVFAYLERALDKSAVGAIIEQICRDANWGIRNNP